MAELKKKKEVKEEGRWDKENKRRGVIYLRDRSQ
jgi:hypothetical protein